MSRTVAIVPAGFVIAPPELRQQVAELVRQLRLLRVKLGGT